MNKYCFFQVVFCLLSISSYGKYHINFHNNTDYNIQVNTALISNNLSSNKFKNGSFKIKPHVHQEILWVNYDNGIKYKTDYLFQIETNSSNSIINHDYTITLHGDIIGSSIKNIQDKRIAWDNPKDKKIKNFSLPNSIVHEIIAVSNTRKTTQGIDDIDLVITDSNAKHYQRSEDNKQLTLATYNVQIWPFYADASNPPNHKVTRTLTIPQYLSDYDVVAVQELFQNDAINSLGRSLRSEFINIMQQNGFSYHYGPIEEAELPLSGGVVVFSHWPIEQSQQALYNHCSGDDCLAAKGISYIKINKNGMRYNIIASHLNALKNDNQAIQTQQINELRTFVSNLQLPTIEPTVLLGDFNSPLRPISALCEQLYRQYNVLHDELFIASDYLQSSLALIPIHYESNSLCFSSWPHINTMNKDSFPALYDAVYLLKNKYYEYSHINNRVYPLLALQNANMYPNIDLSDHFITEAKIELK